MAADGQPPTLLFMHVPKTGGRTLLRLARRQYPAARIAEIYGDIADSLARFRAMPDDEKAGLAFVAGHYPFGLHREIRDPCRYLTLLRHPVRRVVSDYFYMKGRRGHWAHERIQEEGLSLEGVLDNGLNVLMDNGQTRILSSARDTVPMGELGQGHLDEAKRNLRKHFAVVGITERLGDSFAVIKRTLSWHGWHIPKVNARPTPPPPLGARVRRRIESLNRFDLELYEFACGLLDEQLAAHRGARWTARIIAGISRAQQMAHTARGRAAPLAGQPGRH